MKSSVTGLMKNMQPDPGLNRGPSANALPTELPDCQHIIHLVPVLTQVTSATVDVAIETFAIDI